MFPEFLCRLRKSRFCFCICPSCCSLWLSLTVYHKMPCFSIIILSLLLTGMYFYLLQNCRNFKQNSLPSGNSTSRGCPNIWNPAKKDRKTMPERCAPVLFSGKSLDNLCRSRNLVLLFQQAKRGKSIGLSSEILCRHLLIIPVTQSKPIGAQTLFAIYCLQSLSVKTPLPSRHKRPICPAPGPKEPAGRRSFPRYG